MTSMNASRRLFLKRAGAMSITGAATPWAMNLAAMGEAAAANATGYKALVCVFLNGGNDHANTVVPYDAASHAIYARERGLKAFQGSTATGVGIPKAMLAQAGTVLAPAPGLELPGGRQYALAPELKPLMPLFDSGKLAVMLNIGTLVEPVTKGTFLNGTARLPPKLFSHNDQTSFYQSEGPEGNTTGWGGRIGDLYAAGNGKAVFTCISASGNAVFLSGSSAVAYQVSASGGGAVPINGILQPLFGSSACSDALRELITAPRSHLFESAHAAVVQRSIAAEAVLTPALPARSTRFDGGGSLSAQLSMVARIIAARDTLGAKRQVFYVSLGGFDLHDGLADAHGPLLEEVAGALEDFHAETVALGVEDQVTTFTASEFGRTLNSNGDGSDHGWGSMHFVLGGAASVNGGRLHGTAPVTGNNEAGDDDAGRGRLIPTTSVDQFGATLARWFGVEPGELAGVFPNLENFGATPLPFMKLT